MASPPAPGRLRRDALANRDRILTAARTAFAARGLEVTVDEVAREAGVGVATVYRRFPTKERLVDAIFDERIDELALFAERAAAAGDAWQGLCDLLARAVELQATDRGFADVLAVKLRDERLTASVRARLRPAFETLISRARAAGRLRDDVTYEDVSVLLWSSGRTADATHDVAPGYWRRHLALVLDALRAERATPLPGAPLTRPQHRRALERLAGARPGRPAS